MRQIGLIGGMSAESTAIYYRLLNEGVRDRLGGLHSCPLILWSVDFAEIAELQKAGAWSEAGAILAGAARALCGAGAEAILICANTMHLVAGDVAAAVDVPLIHIADATAHELQGRGAKRPLLLATRFTMEMGFYRDRMNALGMATLTPNAEDRARLHAIIYDELCQGQVEAASRQAILEMIDRGRAAGADSVILGCTELGLVIDPRDMDLITVDSAQAHVDAALAFALG